MRIAITGATGRLGRHAVDVLEQAGHDVVPLSRATGEDVITGAGLDAAFKGADVVIDAATGPSPDEREATDFFTTAAHNIQNAALRAGVRRIVVVSIVGADRFSGGYNAAKVAQERVMLDGPVPARILRATQFHEFVEQLLAWGTQGDVAYLPEFRTQLVAARSVAEVLADLVAAPDGGPTISEVAGPRAEDLGAMARLLAARRGGPSRIEVVRDPGDHDQELYASGAALPGPDATLAGPTFEEWLEANVPVAAQ